MDGQKPGWNIVQKTNDYSYLILYIELLGRIFLYEYENGLLAVYVPVTGMILKQRRSVLQPTAQIA